MSCHKLRLISYMDMYEHDNHRELVAKTGFGSPRTLSSNTVVIVSGTAAKLEPAKDYKKLTLSRQWKNKL